MNYVTDGDLKKVLRGIGKKTPRGIMLSDTSVGYVTWQMTMKNDYLKLDGSELADASTNYPELLAYAIENNLVTSDTTQTLKFRYDGSTDKLTLPDFSSLNTNASLIPQIRFKKASSVWDLLEWYGLYRNKAYTVGDIAYSKNLPSYLRLECVTAGITSPAELAFPSPVIAGQYITDGTAVFILTDIRDGAQVGDIKLSPILRNGYVKANGALLTSARTNYPRLITFVTENPSLNAANDTVWNNNKALYVYNSTADTLRVPDATGRVLQGGSAAGMLEAGLPNINGTVKLITGGNQGIVHKEWNGAFIGQHDATVYAFQQINSSAKYFDTLAFIASKSNSIYGSSTTVQSPALTLVPQIKY